MSCLQRSCWIDRDKRQCELQRPSSGLVQSYDGVEELPRPSYLRHDGTKLGVSRALKSRQYMANMTP